MKTKINIKNYLLALSLFSNIAWAENPIKKVDTKKCSTEICQKIDHAQEKIDTKHDQEVGIVTLEDIYAYLTGPKKLMSFSSDAQIKEQEMNSIMKLTARIIREDKLGRVRMQLEDLRTLEPTLFEKAVKSLPEESDRKEIDKWLKYNQDFNKNFENAKVPPEADEQK